MRKIKRVLKSNIFKNILLLLLVLFSIYIVGEITVRYHVYKQTGYNPKSIKYNPNSEGFRDYEHEIKKSNGTMRILILGDSFTFGQGVRNSNKIYPTFLDKLLNKKNQDYKYEIINFGVPGYNLIMKINELKKKGLKYKPDIVILQHRFWGGDTKLLKNNDLLNTLDFKTNEYNLYFIRWLNRKIRWMLFDKRLKEGWRNYSITIYGSSSENAKLLKNSLKELNSLSKKNNFTVLCVNFVWVPKNNWFSEHHEKYSYEFIKDACEENNFLFLNLYNLYEQYTPRELRLNMFDAHPNEKGHEIAAKAVYNFLIEERLVSDVEK